MVEAIKKNRGVEMKNALGLSLKKKSQKARSQHFR